MILAWVCQKIGTLGWFIFCYNGTRVLWWLGDVMGFGVGGVGPNGWKLWRWVSGRIFIFCGLGGGLDLCGGYQLGVWVVCLEAGMERLGGGAVLKVVWDGVVRCSL